MIGDTRHECLKNVVALGEHHLRPILNYYSAHHHGWRYQEMTVLGSTKTRAALMAGTLPARSESLNGLGGDRQAPPAAWPGHVAARDAPRYVAAIPRQSVLRERQAPRPSGTCRGRSRPREFLLRGTKFPVSSRRSGNWGRRDGFALDWSVISRPPPSQ